MQNSLFDETQAIAEHEPWFVAGTKGWKQAMDMPNRLADMVGNQNHRTTLKFSSKHLQAQKLYMASLFDTLEQREKDRPLTKEEQGIVYRMYFSYSPSMAEYVGGFSDMLDLYLQSLRSESGRQLSGLLMGHLQYAGTFYDVSPSLMDTWKRQTKESDKLTYLAALEKLTYAAEDISYGNDEMLHSMRSTLHMIENSETTTALETAYAKTITGKSIESSSTWVTLDELPEEQQQSLMEDWHSRKEAEEKEQWALLKKLAHLVTGPHTQLRRISSDACAAVERGEIVRIATEDGKERIRIIQSRQIRWGTLLKSIRLLQLPTSQRF